MDKSKVIANLLQPSSSSSVKGSSLIVDLEPSPLDDPVPVSTSEPQQTQNQSTSKSNNDEPTMFEMMMAAQKAAAAEQKIQVEIEKKVEESVFANGFKKGFFGASKPKTNKISTSTTPASSVPTKPKTDFDDDIIDLTGVKSAAPKNTSSKKKINLDMKTNRSTAQDGDKFVFDDVQKALEEDKHPLLQKINQNEWVTPDLLTVFQSNKILAQGFKDPKCMAAMQLMQSDPKEAVTRYQGDPEVSAFLREFGAAMAKHFEKMAAEQAATQQPAQTQQAPAAAPIIQEVGPLQAQAMQRQREAATSSTLTAAKAGTAGKKQGVVEESEEERVQRILQDTELRALLMDAGFQALLLECNDPRKYQQHMRDPETARKIRKLHESGLVKTQV